MKELPKVYEPQQVEGRIYRMWMDHDCFKATPDPDKKPFSIVMPPPNVTGQLHMGHAMETFKKKQKASELTEDDLKIAEKDLQKLTDDMCKELDALLEKKEKELMEV